MFEVIHELVKVDVIDEVNVHDIIDRSNYAAKNR